MKSIHWFLLIVTGWFSFFWWSYSLSASGILTLEVPPVFIPLGGIGMLLVMVIFIKLTPGERRTGPVFKRTIAIKHPLKWYGLAVVPSIILLLAMTAYSLIFPEQGVKFSPVIAPAIFIGLVFAWIEETIWRGYALPELLNHHSLLTANIILTITWLLFHLPLFIVPDYNAYGITGWLYWAPWYIIYTFFLNWLAVKIKFSTFILTLSHFLVNWVITWFQPPWMENIASLYGSILLTVVVVIMYRSSSLNQMAIISEK